MTHDRIELPILQEYLKDFRDVESSIDLSNFTPDSEESITADKLLIPFIGPGIDHQVDDAARKGTMVPLKKYSKLESHIPLLVWQLRDRFPNCSIVPSGHFLYPKGGGMSWHTNSDSPYLRCYLNYSENGDSFFKYFDMKSGKTYISMDYVGWNLRTFHINKEVEKRFWHCVYSKTTRISLGFRIVSNLKK